MRVLVTGAGGQLGAALERALARHDATLLDHAGLDVTDATAVEGVLRSAAPDAIVHAAAWTDVDACEGSLARARAVHVDGTRAVVEAAGAAFVVVVSTDYVFDGSLGRAYVETDEARPLQVYGETKLEAERVALSSGARAAVVRSAWLYGARTRSGAPARNFVTAILGAAGGGPFEVVDDQVGSPTWVEDLAAALVSVCESRATGVYHVAGAGAVSRYEFARAILAGAGADPAIVRPVSTAAAPPRPARRPAYAPLEGKAWAAAGFGPLAPWDAAIARALPELVGDA